MSKSKHDRALQSFEHLKEFAFLEKIAVKIPFVQAAIADGDDEFISTLNEAWHMVQVEVMHLLVTCAQIPITEQDA